MKTKRSNSALWIKNYSAFFLYCLLTVLVMLAQNAPRLLPTVAHARPVPVVLFVVCVSLFEGARTGSMIGLLAGLLLDLYAFRLFGFSALILMGIGLAVGLLVEWLLRANFYSAMLLCAGAALWQALMEWFFCYVIFDKEQIWPLLFKVYLPNF
ncbi:MAG: rod shape-determining protein MreD, partial [Clostridia bacterium]|nr:rod shape-determining protein MreD [Clostridia bacterium]